MFGVTHDLTSILGSTCKLLARAFPNHVIEAVNFVSECSKKLHLDVAEVKYAIGVCLNFDHILYFLEGGSKWPMKQNIFVA